MNNLNVLFEDNHIIVVVKPCNILSQSDSTGDIDMLSLVKMYIKKKYNKPGNVYVGLVHRLDRPVGGIMVFAKSSKAASRLSNDIKEKKFCKRYLAVVNGILEKKEGTLIDYLNKNSDGNTIITTNKNGKKSILNYKVIDENKSYNLSLVAIELLTGRHHQIRVQFASRNCPLYGDQRYGILDNKQIALWAYEIQFVHPVKKKLMKFTVLPSKNGIWEKFNIKI